VSNFFSALRYIVATHCERRAKERHKKTNASELLTFWVIKIIATSGLDVNDLNASAISSCRVSVNKNLEHRAMSDSKMWVTSCVVSRTTRTACDNEKVLLFLCINMSSTSQ
jgi:hypothetical protein